MADLRFSGPERNAHAPLVQSSRLDVLGIALRAMTRHDVRENRFPGEGRQSQKQEQRPEGAVPRLWASQSFKFSSPRDHVSRSEFFQGSKIDGVEIRFVAVGVHGNNPQSALARRADLVKSALLRAIHQLRPIPGGQLVGGTVGIFDRERLIRWKPGNEREGVARGETGLQTGLFR